MRVGRSPWELENDVRRFRKKINSDLEAPEPPGRRGGPRLPGVAAARQHMAREPKINAARAEEEDDELRWRRRRQASSDSKKEAATGAKPKAASAKPTAAADEELQRARRAAEAKAARARATPPEEL